MMRECACQLKNNIYNIDLEFDYPTIKAVVIQSLEKMVKEEALKKRAIADYGGFDD
ncbi:MAG: hypothetical protein ACJ708_03935 [Nitrososphaeraceae archaeon]